jgi:ATP-dependent DNA helicase RecG
LYEWYSIPLEAERLESRLESRLAAKVLMHIKKEAIGKSLLADYLGHKRVSGELHKQIKRLLALKIIEMTLPEKPNSRFQKYRLTKIGERFIHEI